MKSDKSSGFDIDKAIVKARRCQCVVAAATVMGIVLAVCLLIWMAIGAFGNTRLGAILLYSWAMDRKDAKAAVYYAKKVAKVNDFKGPTALAYAHLLNKEPEKSLEAFERAEEYRLAIDFYLRGGPRIYPYYMGVARVHYKMENRREAFEEYCSSLADPRFLAADCNEQIRDTVLCKHLGDEAGKFSPFANYGQFLQFMEEEFTEAGEPEEYLEAIQQFREAKETVAKK